MPIMWFYFRWIYPVQSYEPLRVVNLHYPEELAVTVVHPHVEKTADSKRITAKIPLKTAITQWANVGGLVAGFAQKILNLLVIAS